MVVGKGSRKGRRRGNNLQLLCSLSIKKKHNKTRAFLWDKHVTAVSGLCLLGAEAKFARSW